MSPEDKLLKLFFEVHGVVTGSCSKKVIYDRGGRYMPIAIAVMKDGQECWRATREELVFEYVTRDFTEGW